MPDEMNKRCCRCGIEYSATAEFFSRCKRNRDGLTSQCKSCRSAMWKEQYAKNRDYYIAKSAESTRQRRLRADVREAERMASREAKRRLLEDPLQREKHRQRTREWFTNNRERVNQLPSRSKAIRAHYTSLYNAAELRATPAWADVKAIAEFYREAQRKTEETGIPHEVDHIVPLRHKQASGLHVPENLRVVTRSVNCSKSNRFITEA